MYTELMLILSHIIVALTSIVLSTVSSIHPSIKRITISYSFVGLTVLSGTLLIVISPSNILKTCLVGLLYIVVVTALSVIAHRKLLLAKPGIDR